MFLCYSVLYRVIFFEEGSKMVELKETANKVKEETERTLKKGATLAVGLASAMTLGASRGNENIQEVSAEQNEPKIEQYTYQETSQKKDERTITFEEAVQLMEESQRQPSPEVDVSYDAISADAFIQEDITPEITQAGTQNDAQASIVPEVDNTNDVSNDTITAEINKNRVTILSSEGDAIGIDVGYNELSMAFNTSDMTMETTINPNSVELNVSDGKGNMLSAELQGNKLRSTLQGVDSDFPTVTNVDFKKGTVEHIMEDYTDNLNISYNGKSLSYTETEVNETTREVEYSQTVQYSTDGLRFIDEDSSERVVDEYSGMNDTSGMYKRTTFDKENNTTIVEYGYVGFGPVGRDSKDFAEMEQAYKQACKDSRSANKAEWEEMRQGPEATLNNMGQMARNMKTTRKEALRMSNKLNNNKEEFVIQTNIVNSDDKKITQKEMLVKIQSLRGIGSDKTTKSPQQSGRSNAIDKDMFKNMQYENMQYE